MKKLPLIGFALAATLAVGSQAQQLSEAQQGELLQIGVQYSQKAAMFESMMQGKITGLALELQREGRLDSQDSADEASQRVNTILKDLSGLYGEYIKIKVEFLLKAKNILTVEQKLLLLSSISPQETLPYETLGYMQPDIFDLPINLDHGQRKQLIALEADLMINEVKLERDVELTLLNLEGVIMGEGVSPAKVDPLVMKLAGLATQAVDNRVDYF
ncbi:MAG: hypothetical protein U9P12_09675, partial [Verrucomicrobiota bacterium]|nr:hypothetical protein [Verrucomicrobiota bacterium]